MKRFFKGAAVIAVILIGNMIINIICNMHGVDLDSVSQSAMSAVCALLIYHGLTKNEK